MFDSKKSTSSSSPHSLPNDRYKALFRSELSTECNLPVSGNFFFSQIPPGASLLITFSWKIFYFSELTDFYIFAICFNITNSVFGHTTSLGFSYTVEFHLFGRWLSGSVWSFGQICRKFYKTNLPWNYRLLDQLQYSVMAS
jgi:hypothetical protein